MNTQYINLIQQSYTDALKIAHALEVGDTDSARTYLDKVDVNLDSISDAQLRVRENNNPASDTLATKPDSTPESAPEPVPDFLVGTWADPRILDIEPEEEEEETR